MMFESSDSTEVTKPSPRISKTMLKKKTTSKIDAIAVSSGKPRFSPGDPPTTVGDMFTGSWCSD